MRVSGDHSKTIQNSVETYVGRKEKEGHVGGGNLFRTFLFGGGGLRLQSRTNAMGKWGRWVLRKRKNQMREIGNLGARRLTLGKKKGKRSVSFHQESRGDTPDSRREGEGTHYQLGTTRIKCRHRHTRKNLPKGGKGFQLRKKKDMSSLPGNHRKQKFKLGGLTEVGEAELAKAVYFENC